MDRDLARLSSLERRLGCAFEKRVIYLAPGRTRAYDELEWRGAIVVVESGEIELQSTAGVRRRFGRGDVLWLAGLPLRALRNRGTETAVLVAVSRHLRGSSDEFRADPPSYLVSVPIERIPDEQEDENLTADRTPRAGRREWTGLVVLALPALLLSLDISVLLLALPQLSADLGVGSIQQLWITDIYGFMIAGFLVTARSSPRPFRPPTMTTRRVPYTRRAKSLANQKHGQDLAS